MPLNTSSSIGAKEINSTASGVAIFLRDLVFFIYAIKKNKLELVSKAIENDILKEELKAKRLVNMEKEFELSGKRQT